MSKPKTLFVSRRNLQYSINFDYFTTTSINELVYPYAGTPDLFLNYLTKNFDNNVTFSRTKIT